MKVHFRKPIMLAAFTILALMVMVSGLPTLGHLSAFAKERYQDLQVFAKVLNLVQQYYVEEVDTQKLIHGGLKGMLQELDPHTSFLPPDVYKEFESETSGEFGGLGIEITVQNDILTVISPIEDTPAWKAGIKAGDKVVEINGESTKGFSLVEAAQKMRGKRGSKVRLGIIREGLDKPKEISITRDVVKVRSVKFTDLGEGFGYVRLTSFIDNSAYDFEKVLKKMLKSESKIAGLIIDLRRNPGGLLEQAVKISDLFLTKGVIVSTIGRNKREKDVVFAKEKNTYSGFPLVVLINEFSASASEILAGALQDNRRALIMGQQSFGKGSVQSVVKLGDGSGLKLTVARYYTPSGRSIQAEGIKPDVAIEDVDPEAYRKAVIKRDVRREQDIAGHLLGEREAQEAEKVQGKNGGQNESDGKADKRSKESQAVSSSGWWNNQSAKDSNDLSPRNQLLSTDYQVSQAFNYLKAWKVMEKFGVGAGETDFEEIKTKSEAKSTESANQN